ncbi:MAG: PIN domain-containing protein [Bacteroidota bacterium]|nr:PIN domain-containing protein [Bacteroidota bacterium]
MSGSKYFLDTNAIIASLNGNTVVEEVLQSATWIGTSVICIIEFLSYRDLSDSDRALLYKLVQRIQVIQIENDMIVLEKIANFRMQTSLKTPDSIIAANAIANNAVLISSDDHFKDIKRLTVLKF